MVNYLSLVIDSLVCERQFSSLQRSIESLKSLCQTLEDRKTHTSVLKLTLPFAKSRSRYLYFEPKVIKKYDS
jgi:hypothetical protein